ncbi:hypothetical protein L484_017826 [Morus notabilis]|uniref:F-box associated beta-propeller type 1 domain-containing protein n=1 Tax=Morus notabilis TaxID=981085 RepID=W9QXS2_9ROSA|nr:hypothetical protein L484_017826 [Morus notabilis]
MGLAATPFLLFCFSSSLKASLLVNSLSFLKALPNCLLNLCYASNAFVNRGTLSSAIDRFADNHLHFNKKISPSSTSLFLTYDDFPTLQSVLITISNEDEDDSFPCVVEDLNLSHIWGREDTGIVTASHCNGIISLTFSYDTTTTVFYNPAIRDFKFLPRRPLPDGFRARTAGFGYDSEANDYKFVRILDSAKSECRILDSAKSECIAEVYTLGSDCWKQINVNIEPHFGWNLWKLGVFCKGVYFWWMQGEHEDTILSFDMSTDEFHYIPLPDYLQWEDDPLSLNFMVWNESLAVLSFPYLDWEYVEFWVIDSDFSGAEGPSWTKHLTIRHGPFAAVEDPIIFWKSDELLFRTADEKLVSYNLGTENIRNLPIHGRIPGDCYGHFYMQSLIPVNGGN